jgi:hypothetical protein
MPSPRPTRWSVKLAFAALGCALALGMGELVVRVLGLAPNTNVIFRENYRLSEDPQLGYELVPGSRDGKQRINSSGMRDADYPRAKPAGVYRIAVIGDSIAYGFGVQRSDTLAKQLEDLLRGYASPALQRFEVLNFGVSGYNIDQVVEAARTRALAFAPDLILYAYCLNDPQAFSFEYESLRAQLTGAQRSYREALLQSGQRFLAHSRLWLLLRYALQSIGAKHDATAVRDAQWAALSSGSYQGYFEALYRGPELERLTRGAATLAALAQGAHVPVIALIFPVFVDLDHYALSALHARAASAFEHAGIGSFDLLPVYREMYRRHGALFVHNALHPNALGQRLAALYTVRALIDAGRLPPASRPFQPPSELKQLDDLLEPVVAAARSDHP